MCVYMCAGDVSQKIRPSQTGRSIQPTDQLRHFERPRPNFGTRLSLSQLNKNASDVVTGSTFAIRAGHCYYFA